MVNMNEGVEYVMEVENVVYVMEKVIFNPGMLLYNFVYIPHYPAVRCSRV